MKFRRWIAAAVAVLGAAASAHNIVPEGKRDFEVPFKGAGQMSMVYTPVFFPKGTEGVVVSGEAACLTVAGAVTGGSVTVDASVKSGKWRTAQCILTSGMPMGEMTFVKGAAVGSLELRNNDTELWATPKRNGFAVVTR